jgi:hypothetical protein
MTATNAYWGNYYWNDNQWNATYWPGTVTSATTDPGPEFWPAEDKKKKKKKQPSVNEIIDSALSKAEKKFFGEEDAPAKPTDRRAILLEKLAAYDKAIEKLNALKAPIDEARTKAVMRNKVKYLEKRATLLRGWAAAKTNPKAPKKYYKV